MSRVVAFLMLVLVTNFTLGQYYEDKDISAEPVDIVKRFETKTWKTAYTVPKNQLHLSVFAPVRYGLSSSIEVQTYLGLWAYLTPNLYVKKNWLQKRWSFSSKHGVYYPREGLRILKKDNRNSTLDAEASVPQIFTFQNEIIASYILNPTCDITTPLQIATVRMGIDISYTGRREATFNRMTFYSLYHRTASFFGDKVFYLGVQLDGGLWNRVYYNLGADIYTIDFGMKGIEMQGNLTYNYSQKLSISGGFKYIRTNNQIEKEMHLFPTLDICYRLGKRGKWKKGLFGKNK